MSKFRSFKLGQSFLGMSIEAFEFGNVGARVLILGGVHGNETEGVVASFGLLKNFRDQFDLNIKIVIVPIFNPDGVFKFERLNGNGVDLNRNLPTKDWDPKAREPKYNPGKSPCSESENQALVGLIKDFKPCFILSIHSWNPMLNVNGDCNPEAQIISRLTGYEIKEDIGYPTPGSLGTYAGFDLGIPTLTYEIERGLAHDKILSIHVPAILAALRETQKVRK